MCGIFFYKGFKDPEFLKYQAFKIKHRGPDSYRYLQYLDMNFYFFRLRINGLDELSDQPFCKDGIYLICNGEIYNHKQLRNDDFFEYSSSSDCEIIIHMYKKYGIDRTLQELDGVFSLVLYDSINDILYIARDHLGIRPLYISQSPEGDQLCVSSELKAISFMGKELGGGHVKQFPPRHYWNSFSNDYRCYYHLSFPRLVVNYDISNICSYIYELLYRSVYKRVINSDVEIGCLLSGGLDSSLIASIYSRLSSNPIKTFSIGLEGSPDLVAARKVSEKIGSLHHEYIVTEKEMFDHIEDVIYILGSYDITTVRASLGHSLISKFVSEKTNVKVLFSGEVIDEMGSYLYLQDAPNPEHFQNECIRLLEDIHFFDGLRSDRCISYYGLESRVPFCDKDFLNYYMGIDPKFRMFGDETGRIEKFLLRKTFDDGVHLPTDVLWRRKNGFSDSVSSKHNSLSEIIKRNVEKIVSDNEFQTQKNKYTTNTPYTKESYYYRKIYDKYYPCTDLTPYFWLPKWNEDQTDPSARFLDSYQAD